MGVGTAVAAVAPFVGLLTCMLAHVVVSRAWPALPRVRGILASVAAGVLPVLGLVVAARGRLFADGGEALEMGAVWLLTYVVLTYCYIIGFFNLGESARRIRLLIELYGAGERGMKRDEILSTYNARMIVEVRLRRMLAGGQIRQRGGAYVIGKPVMLTAARVLVALKIAYLGSRSEFGAPPAAG